MTAFVNSMDNFTLNEKGNMAFTSHGVCKNIETNKLNEDLGLVALDSKLIGNHGKTKDSGISDDTLNNLYNMIFYNINQLDSTGNKYIYMSYFIKLIMKTRDITEGNGERMLFYKLLLRLNETNSKLVCNLLPYITGEIAVDSESDDSNVNFMPYGSFLDLNNLYVLCHQNSTDNNKKLQYRIIEYIVKVLKKDMDATYPSLAVKWIPRENNSVDRTSQMCYNITCHLFEQEIYDSHGSLSKSDLLKMYRNYYKSICNKLTIIETLMAENRWDEIEVKDIPAKAFVKYLKAFKYENKDGSLREPYNQLRMILRNKVLTEQKKAEEKPESSRINTKTLFPHEIVKVFMNNPQLCQSDIDSYNALWSKYTYEFKKKMGDGIIPPGVVLSDVSGSMTGTPMEACIALSILLSQSFEGPFKNRVLTFETNPQWHKIDGSTLKEKVDCLKKAPWGGTTNLYKALSNILEVSKQQRLSDAEMPKVLYIFSDMQWNQADQSLNTGYEEIKKQYNRYKYTMPSIVFWDLRGNNSYNNNTNQENTTMMSGSSPNLFKAFMNGKFIQNTPWNTLKDLLSGDRYNILDSTISKHLKF